MSISKLFSTIMEMFLVLVKSKNFFLTISCWGQEKLWLWDKLWWGAGNPVRKTPVSVTLLWNQGEAALGALGWPIPRHSSSIIPDPRSLEQKWHLRLCWEEMGTRQERLLTVWGGGSVLPGDRWPPKPAVIATYWSGICDQCCLYREDFKYKLHRISVGEDKSPVWWRCPSSSPRVTMEQGRGQGTAQPEPPLQSLPKTRLPSSFPGVLNSFNPKISSPAWPWVSGMWQQQAQSQLPSAAPTLNSQIPKFLFSCSPRAFHANPAFQWEYPLLV